MKNLRLLLVGMLVIGLLASTAVVLASPIVSDPASKPGGPITPGMRATDLALTLTALLPVQSTPGAVASDEAETHPGKHPEKVVPGAKANGKAVGRTNDKSNENEDENENENETHEGLGQRQVFQGTVEAVGTNSLGLKLTSGDVVTFVVSDTVKINILGVNAHAMLSDVTVGSRALVLAQPVANGSPIAFLINVFPAKPERIQRVGIVTAFTPGVSITIQGPSGIKGVDDMTSTQNISTTFIIISSTVILPADRASQLKVGTRVTIIAPNAAAQGGQMVAQGIVIHPANETDETEP